MYINHDAALEIFKQTSLIIVSIDKLNLRLVRTSNYIQRFDLKLRHKLDKAHIISDALSRLASINMNIDAYEEDELNALLAYIFIIVDLDKVFRKKIIKNYTTDLN